VKCYELIYGELKLSSSDSLKFVKKTATVVKLVCELQQQEQDPTNLYFANLPVHMTESDLEAMLSAYSPVTSTRILCDQHCVSRGVGFARMESKEKCEAIIKAFSGKLLQGLFS